MKRKWLTFSNFMTVFLIIVNVLPVLAPIFMSWGWIFPAKIIYFIYSFTCHQIHWRSVHIADHQCAWCARDMAIWGGVLVVFVLLRIFKLKGLKAYHILPFMMPIALDGGIQTLSSVFSFGGGGGSVYISTNLMRAITGGFFGVGLGAVLAYLSAGIDGFLGEGSHSGFILKLKKVFNRSWKVILLSFVTILVSYFGFVQLWYATSTSYEPTNFLDSEVKVPPGELTTINRREHGACPVSFGNSTPISARETLALECFFGTQD